MADLKQPISKLKKIELRDVWGHEALSFTRWLSETENLDQLSREIGISIKLIQTEANVGRFNVDILAEEESTGRKIIIENQLEDTNHDHLGKIITYASGYDAEIIIWIVKDYREEHQKAIDWLNEHTDENISFFLIKLELWQIENSSPAPKFEVIISPNEWAKVIKTSSVSEDITNTKLQQLEFWTKLKSHIQAKDTKIRLQTPRPQHWYDVSIGNSFSHVALTVNTQKSLIGCELYIPDNKELFKYLESNMQNIENELGEKAEWVDASKASMIKIKKPVDSVFDQSSLDGNFSWLYEKTILFQKVFGRYISEFRK